MYIGLTEEQERLRQEVRAYYERAAHARGAGEARRRRRRRARACARSCAQMGADGWLGVGWPKEWGGRGFTPVEQFIWFDESMRAGAPVPMLTINTVGPTIMNFGTDEQKEFFLPKILKGEIHFCIGYSEPGAGTDLAALRTQGRARRRRVRHQRPEDVDEPRQRRRLRLARGAHEPEREEAQGHLAVRDPDGHAGHQGRPDPRDGRVQHQPGVLRGRARARDDRGSARRTRAGSSSPTSSTTSGSRCARRASSSARSTTCATGRRDTKLADGRRVIDQEWVQLNLARVHARLEFLRLINWKIAWASTKGALHPADASSTKVFGTEFYLEAFRLLMEILGQHSYLKDGAPGVGAPGAPRAPVPRPDHPHVRRRRERGAARPDRGVRPRHAPRPPIANGANQVDFSFNEEQQDLQDLATQILEGELTHERLKEVEGGDENFDRELWAKLAEAGLLGIALPEAQGGGGYGFLEAALVLEQVGRTVAPVPYFATVVLGGAPDRAVRHRRAAQARCSPASSPARRCSRAALVESGADPLHADHDGRDRDGDGWVLDGVKDCVPAGHGRRPGARARDDRRRQVVARASSTRPRPVSRGSARTRRTSTPKRASRSTGVRGRRRRRARLVGRRRRRDPRVDRRARHGRAVRDRDRRLRGSRPR